MHANIKKLGNELAQAYRELNELAPDAYELTLKIVMLELALETACNR